MTQPFGFIALKSQLATPFNDSIITMVLPEDDLTNVYINDVVTSVGKADSTGLEICRRATPADTIRGVVVSIDPDREYENVIYRKGGVRRLIKVIQDPFIVCEVMVNAAITADDLLFTYDIDTAGGNTVTGMSLVQLDYASRLTEFNQFKIIDVVKIVNTRNEQYTIVRCIVSQAELILDRSLKSAYWERVQNDLVPGFDFANISLKLEGRGKDFLDPIDDTDVVNKRTLETYVADSVFWQRVNNILFPKIAGDDIDLQQAGSGLGFLDPVNDYDVVNKRFFLGYLAQFPILTVTPEVQVLTVTSTGQTAFTLNNEPFSSDSIIVSVNGQIFYRDNGGILGFTVSGTNLTWSDPYGITLDTTDTVIAWYNFSTPIPPASLPTYSYGKRTIVDVITTTYVPDNVNSVGKIFTNSGNPTTLTFNLQAADPSSAGVWFEFNVLDPSPSPPPANAIKINAPATQKLIYNDIEVDWIASDEIGASLTLMVGNDLKFYIKYVHGTWIVP
jgi:hypothetical protein